MEENEKEVIEIIKPIQDIKVVEINKKAYNVIRSFVESSDKDIYPWNKGYRLGNTVFFIKDGKWRLEIYTVKEKDIRELEDNRLAIIASLDDVIRIAIDNKFNVKIYVEHKEFDSTDMYSVAFISNVQFSRPIMLSEIIEKLEEYFRIK